ncbi:Spy/CpxP family protein refolding chaperone [Dongia soli]|uniref:Spy/CpxP family protein refolding chaperone n=1 Tax=Dongia soli TaxID=600628 RepID=A0ABU5EG11_9PROT|nr:Spy/CpxP family protein refolding chaperone [Dongia soli]MDY0885158.1 Spy/CpxP family protein refolding chaperone [Dongia soli]
MRISVALLAAVLGLAVPAATEAQTAAPATDHTETIRNLNEGRIAFIATALNLTEEQKPLWVPVADFLRQQNAAWAADEQEGGKDRDRAQPLSALLEGRAARLEQQAAEDRKFGDLLSTLEAKLTDEQREILKLAFFATRPRLPQTLNRTGERWLADPDFQ